MGPFQRTRTSGAADEETLSLQSARPVEDSKARKLGSLWKHALHPSRFADEKVPLDDLRSSRSRRKDHSTGLRSRSTSSERSSVKSVSPTFFIRKRNRARKPSEVADLTDTSSMYKTGKPGPSDADREFNSRDSVTFASSTDDSSISRHSNERSGADVMAPDFTHKMLRWVQSKPKPSSKHHSVIQALMAASTKEPMLDVTLVGRGGVEVKAIRYILACRNQALGQLLCPSCGAKPDKVQLGDYDSEVLRLLFNYCISGELPLQEEESAANAQALVEIVELASQYQFQSLHDDAHQMARRLMNRKLALACAIFDVLPSRFKEFEVYAMHTIQDNPREALLGSGNGVQYLSAEKLQRVLEALVSEEEDRTEEILHLQILLQWYNFQGRSKESLKACRKYAKLIDLERIDEKDLDGVVRKSGFFDVEAIEDALARRGSVTPSVEHADIERVKVSGAGLQRVNGFYIRREDRDGQAMYAKGDLGLCQWESKWIIGPLTDLSNLYYICAELEPDVVPEHGWRVAQQGIDPPPTCLWFEPASPFSAGLPERRTNLPACFENAEHMYGN